MFRLVTRTARSTLNIALVLCLYALLALLHFSSSVACANDDHTNVDCQNTVWEVSTRSLCYSICNASQPCKLPTARYQCGSWNSSSEDLLIADMQQDPLARTIMYIHGNRTTQDEAREKALTLIRLLGCRSDQPIRLIIFSWPSEKPATLIPKRIVEDKKATIQVSGFYLAGLLGRFPPDEIEGAIGFSFGCPIVSAALHLQAGGTLCGRTLVENQHHLSKSMRLGFIAPAFDRNALTECGEYSQAHQLVEILVNLYNSNDPILKRFRLFDKTNPDAAGLLGLVPSQHQPLALRGCIVQYDCSSLIGRTHAEMDYYTCSKLSILLDNVLGKPIER